MKLSSKAKEIYSIISKEDTKLGDLRKVAKEIKRDHELALELWNTGEFHPRMLATLILDKKQLSQEVIDGLVVDMDTHEYKERNYLADWLMANQLTKDRKTIALMESWENNPSSILRRIFWYYQGRLRWSTRIPPDNAGILLSSLEQEMGGSEPEVQWAMNFTAAQIGIHEPEHRSRCITLGEKLGLYRDEKVPKGCTPLYMPEWIRIEVEKLKL